jgi:hypothetical protein
LLQAANIRISVATGGQFLNSLEPKIHESPSHFSVAMNDVPENSASVFVDCSESSCVETFLNDQNNARALSRAQSVAFYKCRPGRRAKLSSRKGRRYGPSGADTGESRPDSDERRTHMIERGADSAERRADRGERRPDRGERRPDRAERRSDTVERGADRPGTRADKRETGADRAERCIDKGQRRGETGERRADRGESSVDNGERRTLSINLWERRQIFSFSQATPSKRRNRGGGMKMSSESCSFDSPECTHYP